MCSQLQFSEEVGTENILFCYFMALREIKLKILP